MVEQRRGSADHPLSRDEVEAKFRRIAAVVLPPSAIQELIELVGKIDRQPDVGRLVKLITAAV
jgi:hypothetical protein